MTTDVTTQPSDWRETVTWPTQWTIVPHLVRICTWPILKLIMQVEITGLHNLPESQFILASNHISGLDILVIGNYLPRQPLFMAKEELFKNVVLGWAFRMAGTFPVRRGRRDLWAMAQAGKVLQAGQMLTIFPEGTRSGSTAQLRRGKSGMVMLALEHNAPIVPLAILGTQKVRPGRVRPKVTLQFGEAIDLAPLAGPPPHLPPKLRELTTLVMQRIAAMLPPEHRGVYAE